MGDERFYDFDEALDSIEGEPIPVRLFGKKWYLPPDGDAYTIIKVQRVFAVLDEIEQAAKDDPEREVTDEERMRFQEATDFDWDTALRKLVGDDNADAWYATGKLGLERMISVMMLVTSIYGGASPADVVRMGNMFGQALGEARAPSTNGAKTSRKRAKTRTSTSSSGRSSKRTSSASTK